MADETNSKIVIQLVWIVGLFVISATIMGYDVSFLKEYVVPVAIIGVFWLLLPKIIRR